MALRREWRKTSDGSPTLFVPELDEHYHSVHGALRESLHVFIDAGLRKTAQLFPKTQLKILEIGWGTGLNCLLTYRFARENKLEIQYTGIEKYPLDPAEIDEAHLPALCGMPAEDPVFRQMHGLSSGKSQKVDEFFHLEKQETDLRTFSPSSLFHLIYFDAFAPSAQPELWTQTVFREMYDALSPSGILITYCAKGEVKRNMKATGFVVEGLPGPPGKREMTRAQKPR